MPEAIIIVVGIALTLVLSTITIAILRSATAGSPTSLLRGIGIFLVVVGRIIIALLLFLVFAVLMGPVGIIGWLVLTFVIIEGTRKYRATRQYGLLWLLTVSAERFMPLAPAIEAFAMERGGAFSRRAKQLAKMLHDGVPLPDALDQCPGLLPPYAVPMVRVGFQTGTLAPALRQAANVHDLHEPVWMALNGKIAYLLLLPACGFMLLTFIMLKIVPSFEKIFKDFGTALPSMTVGLIQLAYFSLNYWFLFLPAYLFGPLLLFYLPMRYFGWTTWDLPGMGRFTRRFDSAQVLDTLALVAGQHRPLPEGIAALAQSYPKEHIRRRLRLVMAEIASGGDWCESLCRHGLMRQPELAILHSAQRVGNLPWALHEMADSVRRRLAYRMQALTQVLFPPIVILLGLVVMFIVVALFLPLLSLITKLAG
jgi:type II secretory pathway component PulF